MKKIIEFVLAKRFILIAVACVAVIGGTLTIVLTKTGVTSRKEKNAVSTETKDFRYYSVDYMDEENEFITVHYSSSGDGVLVLDFLDENTEKVLATQTEQIYGAESAGELKFFAPEELPEDYLLAAHIEDDEKNQLSEEYKSVICTSQYKKHRDSKPEDFPDSDIIMLDETGTSFGILNDGVKEVYCSCEEEDDCYIIDVSDEFTKGDKLFFANDNIMTTVEKSETVSDGRTKIYPVKNAEISDYFDYLKLDANFSYIPNVDIDTTVSDTKAFRLPLDYNDGKVKGEVQLTWEFNCAVRIYYDRNTPDDFYCRILPKVTCTSDLSIEAEGKKERKSTINVMEKIKGRFEKIKLPITTTVPGLDFFFEIEPFIKGSVSGKGEMNMVDASAKGIEISKNKTVVIKPMPKNMLNLSFEGEASLSAGFEADIGLEYFKTVRSSWTNQPEFIVSLSTEVDKSLGVENEEDDEHLCDLCLSGEAKIHNEGGIKLSAGLTEKLLLKKNFQLYDFTKPIKVFGGDSNFYISVLNSEGSIFGGKLSMGGGICPNRSTSVPIVVVDSDGNSLENTFGGGIIKVIPDGEKNGREYVASSGKTDNIPLEKGTYTLKINFYYIEGVPKGYYVTYPLGSNLHWTYYNFSQTVTVNNDTDKIEIKLPKANRSVRFKVNIDSKYEVVHPHIYVCDTTDINRWTFDIGTTNRNLTNYFYFYTDDPKVNFAVDYKTGERIAMCEYADSEKYAPKYSGERDVSLEEFGERINSEGERETYVLNYNNLYAKKHIRIKLPKPENLNGDTIEINISKNDYRRVHRDGENELNWGT